MNKKKLKDLSKELKV